MLNCGFHQLFTRFLPDFQDIQENKDYNIKGKGINSQLKHRKDFLQADGYNNNQGQQPDQPEIGPAGGNNKKTTKCNAGKNIIKSDKTVSQCG